MPLTASGLYFEDFFISGGFITGAREILADDVTAFAAITGDMNPLHTDAAFMAAHPLERPVVHGMLVAAIGVGLISRVGLTRGTLVAMLEQHIVYKSPVYVGDTVHAKLEVIDKRETKNPMRGIVRYRFEILNADGIVVVEGTNTNMVFRKSTQEVNGESI